MDTFLFTIASKKLKYLGINLTKEMKNLYSEHFKPLKKEIKTLENGKTVLVHESLDNDHFTKNYRSNSIKILISLFTEIEKSYNSYETTKGLSQNNPQQK